MKRDQKFFDMYSLVIGVLAIFALAILVLAMKMTDVTQDVFTSTTDEYKAEVAKRLKPFGEVYLPGEEAHAGEPVVTAAEPAAPVTTALTGPQVYNEACIACHGSGIAGAPKVGDAAAWTGRVAQGNPTLYEHAINGYQGSAGYMPAKGARMDLSDQEVRDAVDYMVSQSK
ncbi:MAG: c-type cytochrome [Gammaproteobacteria bacterium]|nr:c-type cytochrome [Gammaproteobacteria bacterium]MDH4314438.1 c-type cytochrome [Gammaproteobacteria bacterium]MDH5213287.1 c-type cytochrome [Gammaproteobacteria bacterium]